jgi:Zn-dependent protease/predicted transcriptional regulator
MSKRTIPLGHILGISIGLDPSWFFIFALITWSLAVSYYPAEFGNWPSVEYWVVGAVTVVIFFASVVLHELGHSVVAQRYKIPVRSITLFIFGGVAQISAEPPSAAAEFWIAIAGPAVSFALAALFSLMQPVFAGFSPVLALAKYLAYINGMLALFNLIPGFPLDGGRVFRAAVWALTHDMRKATRIAATVGRGFGFLFILVGVWQIFTGNLGGLWIAFIGWFLEVAARSQLQQRSVHDLLEGHRVVEVMRRGYASVPADVTLEHLAEAHILENGRRCLMVTKDEKTIGLLAPQNVKDVPRDEWSTTTAARAMVPIAQVNKADPDEELWAALAEMERDAVEQLPVMDDGQCLGVLGREDVIGFLHNRQELSA